MEIKAYLKNKKAECLIQKFAYERWLMIITPFRWTAIILGVILPAIIGATLFVDSKLISEEGWKLVCSAVLLISSVVSGLHAALKCDSHQQECIRLSKQYESLANKFELAITLNPQKIDSQKDALSEKFSELIENTLTTPVSWCIDSARKKVMRLDA